MLKKLIALSLCLIMIISAIPSSVFAASQTLKLETELAEDLKALGLFKGVSDTDFALGRAPTRTEALVMLIRVLGKETDALAKGGKHPFLDVPAWADKYVGYAYENKLTNGISATKFGGSSTASSSMYLTFVLRALGYSDTNGVDFTWDNPFTLARETGILRGNPDTLKFYRADVVLVSYATLESQIKGTQQTLAQKLISQNAISAAAYDKYYDITAFEKTGAEATRELSSSEIYEKCSPAVFYITVYDKNGEGFAIGSGFFIDSEGTAVTNYHVIEGAYSAKIKRSDNQKSYNVLGVYDYSEKNDWAVIKVDGKDFPYLEIDENSVKGGQQIFAIGNPQGLENTISEGLVSNPNRPLDGVPYIQISAPISPGSSGGALINKLGHVVGITTAGFDEGQNLNLAVPISVIKNAKKTTVHPFLALLSDKDSGKELGNVNLDIYPENRRAFELLRMWITNNQNKTMPWGAGVIMVYDGVDAQQQVIVSYDESKEALVLSYGEYGAGDSYELFAQITFGEWEAIELEFKYYEDVEDTYLSYLSEDVNDSATSTLWKTNFKDGMVVSFDNYYGSYDNKMYWEEVCADVSLYLLEWIETVLTDTLSAYEVDGVRALGFENCYFD